MAKQTEAEKLEKRADQIWFQILRGISIAEMHRNQILPQVWEYLTGVVAQHGSDRSYMHQVVDDSFAKVIEPPEEGCEHDIDPSTVADSWLTVHGHGRRRSESAENYLQRCEQLERDLKKAWENQYNLHQIVSTADDRAVPPSGTDQMPEAEG